MASGTITVTIDTGEWSYPDANGGRHLVTNGQTFTLASTDTSATDVRHVISLNGLVTTTDGYKIKINPSVNSYGSQNFGGVLGDTANDNVTTYGNRGEMVCQCSSSGDQKQFFKIKTLKWDNVDNPTSLTLEAEDQFGNYFKLNGVTTSLA